jgi:tetratricopeptide (TPR) repeat protein
MRSRERSQHGAEAAKRFSLIPLYVCSAMFIGGWMFIARLSAEDVVVLKPSGNARAPRRVVGEITEYNGSEVTIRTASGRETSLPTQRVDDVITQYTQAHIDADLLFEQRKFDEAVAQYKEALAAEKRLWVQRQILANISWCQRARGSDVDAAQAFLLIVKHDPQTQYFAAVPLHWHPSELPLGAQRKAMEYLRDEENPVAQLIGASWLLSDTSQRAAAISALEALADAPDSRLALLATAQLWRTQLITSTRADVGAWRSTIDRLPPPLRGGPYFLLGQLLAKEKQYDDAAIALMHPPVLHARDRALAAESLLAAAEVLTKGGDDAQAAICLQELLRDYADLPAAAAAKTMLARQKQGG